MWLGSFPDFMIMLVMFVVRVQVRMVHGLVTMIEFTDIASRPQHCPRYGRTQNKYGESGLCRRLAHTRAQPTRQWICDQPTGMRQRKLRRIQCGTVAFVTRPL